MRFRELRFTAFGPFTDQVVSFGEPGDTDLHIVLGKNEAGKTSALRGIQALLFGIPARTADAFIHPYPNLRLGAVLDGDDGTSLEVSRLKGNKGTLLGADSNPLPNEAGLRNLLGNIDGDLYERLFLVSHKKLRDGGQSLVDGRGDLGVSLFAAMLGTSNLPATRRDLEARANALFSPSGNAKNQVVNKARGEYQAHLRRARELSVKPREYEAAVQLVQELDDLRTQQNSLVADLDRNAQRLRRLQSVTGLLVKHSLLKTDLAKFAEVPNLPADAQSRRERAQEKKRTALEEISKAENTIRKLAGEVEQIDVDEPLLEHESEIRALAADVSRHRNALEDRARRIQDRDAAAAIAAQLEAQLGPVAAAQPAALGAEVANAISEMVEESAGLRERRGAAQKAVVRTQLVWEKASAAKDGAVAPPALSDDIHDWTAQADRELPQLLTAQAQAQSLEVQIGKIDRDAAVLAPPLDLSEQAEPVPAPQTISDHRKRAGDVAEQRLNLESLIKQSETRLRDIRVQIATAAAGDLAGIREQLAAVRTARDETVTELGARLQAGDIGLAQTAYGRLKDAIPQADDLADSLLSQSDLMAMRAKLEAELAELERQMEEHQAQLGELNVLEAKRLEEWRSAWAATGILPLDDVQAMDDWCERCADLISRRADLTAEQGRHAATIAATQRLLDRLGAALTEAGHPGAPGLDATQQIQHAKATIQRMSEALGAYRELVDTAAVSDEARTEAQRDRDEVDTEQQSWKARWRELLEPLSLDPESEPTTVSGTVTQINEFIRKQREVDGFQHRIDAITSDYDEFESTAVDLARAVAQDLVETDVLVAARELDKRVDAARQAETDRNGLARQLTGEQDRLDALRQDVRAAEAILSDLCDTAGADNDGELVEIEQRAAERDELAKQLRDLESSIVQTGERSIEQLEAELAGRDGDQIAADLTTAENELEAARAEQLALAERHQDARNTRDALDHGADAARERELAELDAAQTANAAERYLTERAAAVLLGRAIEYYREQNVNPVLTRASELIPKLTAGSLDGLSTGEDDKDRPVLLGRRPTGTTLTVEEMSDGTVDQLYLALRLAALEEQLHARTPLPILLDDILVHYDEERVAEALPALASVAKHTQVILFTHHDHVATIAHETLGSDVRLHELTRAGPSIR